MRVRKSRWVALGLMVALLWAAPLSWAGVTPAAEHGITGWFQTLTAQVDRVLSQIADWFPIEDEVPSESAANEEEVGPESKELPENEIGPLGEPFG